MALTQTPVCEFGLQAPDFELLGVDGRFYQLADCLGPKGVLVMFICNHCPYVKAILPKLMEDVKTLQQWGIGCVAISSNDPTHYPEDSFDNMRRLALEKGFSFPYLFDETQTVAKSYRAVCTPDFFGYSSSLSLQYRGRLDESGIKAAVPGAKRDLLEAMITVANTGKGPEIQHASQGCSIKWRGGKPGVGSLQVR
jgi:peroxiredoxin